MTDMAVPQGTSNVIGARTVRVAVRPTRCAYLVRPGSRADILAAMAFASTEWGGYTHPIIPAGRAWGHAYAMAVAEAVRPDYLIDFSGGSTEGYDVARHLGAHHSDSRSLLHWRHGLNPLAVVGNELRARTMFEPRRSSRLAEVAALGLLDPDQRGDWVRTGCDIRPIADHLDLLDGQLDVPSPLWAGRLQFETYSAQVWFGGPLIVYVGAMEARRAIGFWNTRAMVAPLGGPRGTDVVWLPRPALRDGAVLQRIVERCLASATDPDLVLVGRDLEAFRSSLEAAGFRESPGTATSNRLSLIGRQERDTRVRPLRYRLNGIPWMWVEGDRQYGRAVSVDITVTRPRTTIAFSSPVAMQPQYPGVVRVGIRGVDELWWPARPEVAALIEPNASFTNEGLTLGPQTSPVFRMEVNLPEPEQVVSAMLGAKGWTWSVSDKGRYAQAVSTAAGDRIGALVDDPFSLAICRQLAGMSTKKAEQAAARIQTERDVDLVAVITSLMHEPPGWWPLDRVVTLLGSKTRLVMPHVNALVAARLIRRAFRYACPTCTVTTAIPLDRADDIVRCDGCGDEGALVGPPSEAPTLLYSVNSLLARAIDQDSIEQLIALRWARNELGIVWGVPGALLTASDGSEREIDLLGVDHDRLVVGEAKAKSQAFTEGVVEECAALAKRIGADLLILASGDEWPAGPREAIVNASEGIEVKAISLAAAPRPKRT